MCAAERYDIMLLIKLLLFYKDSIKIHILFKVFGFRLKCCNCYWGTNSAKENRKVKIYHNGFSLFHGHQK